MNGQENQKDKMKQRTSEDRKAKEEMDRKGKRMSQGSDIPRQEVDLFIVLFKTGSTMSKDLLSVLVKLHQLYRRLLAYLPRHSSAMFQPVLYLF